MSNPTPADRMIELLEAILDELRASNETRHAAPAPTYRPQGGSNFGPKPTTISEKQLPFLRTLCAKKGIQAKTICERFGVTSLENLSYEDAKLVISELAPPKQ
jgi:hypothetical protein